MPEVQLLHSLYKAVLAQPRKFTDICAIGIIEMKHLYKAVLAQPRKFTDRRIFAWKLVGGIWPLTELVLLVAGTSPGLCRGWSR